MARFAVFSLVHNRTTGEGIPVGVVVWSEEQREHHVGFLDPIRDLPADISARAAPYLPLVQSTLDHWVTAGTLPYSQEALQPFQDAWWEHVRKLHCHAIQLSEPRNLETTDLRAGLAQLLRSFARSPADLPATTGGGPASIDLVPATRP